MLSNSKSYIYDISIRGLSHSNDFARDARKAINEINQTVGWDKNTRIRLEPISKQKNLFLLEILTEVDNQPIVVSKTGKMVFSLLKRAKKSVIKQARETHTKNLRKLRYYGSNDFAAAMLWDAS